MSDDEQHDNQTFTDEEQETNHDVIPFSMKFEELKPITSEEFPFRYPGNCKISYSHQCVCVSDDGRNQIKFFDLDSAKLLSKFDVDYAWGLFVEENFDNQHNDALYYGEFDCTIKFRVKDLLEFGNDAEYLWRIERNHQFGMAMRQMGNQKQLFRFDTLEKVMDIIDAENGNIIRSVQLEGTSTALDFVFITPTRMMLSDFDSKKCLIYDEIEENEWKLIRSVEEVDDLPLLLNGMAIDRKGEKIFLSDYHYNRIIVFDKEGNSLCSYKCETDALYPKGLEYDDRNGLLYVADQANHSIRIFKQQ